MVYLPVLLAFFSGVLTTKVDSYLVLLLTAPMMLVAGVLASRWYRP